MTNLFEMESLRDEIADLRERLSDAESMIDKMRCRATSDGVRCIMPAAHDCGCMFDNQPLGYTPAKEP